MSYKSGHKSVTLAELIDASQYTGSRAGGPVTADNRQIRRLRERELRQQEKAGEVNGWRGR